MRQSSRRILFLALAALAALPAAGRAQPSPFRVQPVHTFTPPAQGPEGGLVQLPDGNFYGVIRMGIIRRTPGGAVSVVARLPHSSGRGPLVRASDGALYGVTFGGGPADRGTIFRFDPSTEILRVVHAFTSPAKGTRPIGRLVASDGSLHGVTAEGLIFRVDVATGAVTIEASLRSAGVGPPAGPLTRGADGRLYGATNGNAVYAFDPVSHTLTRVATLAFGDGSLPKSLTLGGDGRLYGNATYGGFDSGGADAGSGTLFRLTPSTGVVELLHALVPANGDGRAPGPLLAASDGNFYGVTTPRNDGSMGGGILFRLRAGAGGGPFTYEPLRQLERTVDGAPFNPVLTQAADGLVYGSLVGGPIGTGTLFRFDPLAGGPPGNPLAFTLLHTFPCLGPYYPSSAPTLAADSHLYGTTNACGDAYRGAVYRVTPATGAVTILDSIPGAPYGQTNSALVSAPDGRLYGTSTAYSYDTSAFTTSIIRVEPSTGSVTIAVSAVAPASGRDRVRSNLVRTPAGEILGVRREESSDIVYRFDPAGDVISEVVRIAADGLSLPIALPGRPLLAFARFQVGSSLQTRTALIRLDPTLPSGYAEIASNLGTDIGPVAAGGDGRLYMLRLATPARVERLDPATGATSAACALGEAGPEGTLSVAADGSLYGTLGGGTIRLFRCDPATGAVIVSTLPPSLGSVVDRLTPVGDLLYGVAVDFGPQLGDVGGGAIFQVATAGAALPAMDSDADGLPNAWETAYGLDPFGGARGSGPADDPDGDGRTNLQELTDGTHPRGFFTRLFAEGAANAFFRTTFDLANASVADVAVVRARLLTDTAATVAADLHVPRLGHLVVDPSTWPAMPPGSFSAIFESDMPLAADRTVSWGAGGYGSHLETGIAAPSTTWYFAEGSTSGSFSLFYLLQNPQATPVTATVRYLRPSGQAPIERSYSLPPAGRTTIVVDGQHAALASTDVSAVITATAPIVAERAMYADRPGQPFAAGHESAGVTAPALDWFLAEGATGAFFDLFVLIANPSPTPSVVDVEYLRSSGPALVKRYVVPAQSRMTIWVDDEQFPAGSGQRPLSQGSVSTAVHVTNGVPVIVERAMWWPGPETTASFWYEAHNSPGSTTAATRWAIGGGEIGGADGASTYVLIANAADRAGRIALYVLDDGGDTALFTTRFIDLAPKSRTTLDLAALWPTSTAPRRVGLLIESVGDDPVPVVVERAAYANPGGVFWGRGGNALAMPLP